MFKHKKKLELNYIDNDDKKKEKKSYSFSLRDKFRG